MKSTMDAKTTEIGEILTAIQFAKYKELLAQRNEGRKGPPKNTKEAKTTRPPARLYHHSV
jgi:hypothetical protein